VCSSDLDQTKAYHDDVIRDCCIEAMLRGAQPIGNEFNVIFPVWYRGPQGVALYIRGFENFSLDLYLNEALAHRILRYVTDAAKAYASWRSRFLDEPIAKGDLFNEFVKNIGIPYSKEIRELSKERGKAKIKGEVVAVFE
jgi:hypothetical protein